MDDIVIREMSKGASKTEVCAEIGIDKATLYNWCNPESDYFKQSFFNAVKRGEQLSKAWWLKMGRQYLVVEKDAPQLNYTGWYMNMKNRFGWADKKDVNANVDGNLKITIIDRFGANDD
jgi:hypothetical protein